MKFILEESIAEEAVGSLSNDDDDDDVEDDACKKWSYVLQPKFSIV